MARTMLLKKIEGLEIWTTVGGGVQHFAVKVKDRRLRMVESLAAAEALMADRLRAARALRAH